jgi:hypothetical protein
MNSGGATKETIDDHELSCYTYSKRFLARLSTYINIIQPKENLQAAAAAADDESYVVFHPNFPGGGCHGH